MVRPTIKKTYYGIEWDSGIIAREVFSTRKDAMECAKKVNAWFKRRKMHQSKFRIIEMFLMHKVKK